MSFFVVPILRKAIGPLQQQAVKLPQSEDVRNKTVRRFSERLVYRAEEVLLSAAAFLDRVMQLQEDRSV